ncbi:energy transducer TonB [Rhizorhabdus argentea]|uniref:energy transducer TonB n=1 Tax=Rhizorhabdus argentea TaxID=1387174 RepID=UPI0030ED5835
MMHATLDRRAGLESEALFYTDIPDPARGQLPIHLGEPRSPYGEQSNPNWPMIITILALHVAALFALVKLDVIHVARPKPAPLVIDLISEPAPPPLVERPKPEPVVEQKIEPQPVTAPPQVIQTVAPPPPPVMVTVAPTPPKPVPVVQPSAGPMTVGDLEARMIEGKPPRYPMESRRKREQGTVLLRLLIGTDGGVEQVSIAQSSGFDRLDQAALQAARGWRWQPMIRDGAPVAVRGVMPIPFVLKS